MKANDLPVCSDFFQNRRRRSILTCSRYWSNLQAVNIHTSL